MRGPPWAWGRGARPADGSLGTCSHTGLDRVSQQAWVGADRSAHVTCAVHKGLCCGRGACRSECLAARGSRGSTPPGAEWCPPPQRPGAAEKWRGGPTHPALWPPGLTGAGRGPALLAVSLLGGSRSFRNWGPREVFCRDRRAQAPGQETSSSACHRRGEVSRGVSWCLEGALGRAVPSLLVAPRSPGGTWSPCPRSALGKVNRRNPRSPRPGLQSWDGQRGPCRAPQAQKSL